MFNLVQTQPNEQFTWLVTGAAGFIGSNLVEALLRLNQRVIGLDNLCTGTKDNLEEIKEVIGDHCWANFNFIEGDIRDLSICKQATKGVDFVLHQAALGSVPRSIQNPVATNDSNIGGFVNILEASRASGVKRFIYASSSSVYGDSKELPKQEDKIGSPISPYAVSKLANELYARVFSATYGIETFGLRYFNVFGRRQRIDGPYAAVIPQWIGALLKFETVYINGDGGISRDFCYIDNVVQANISAALADKSDEMGGVYNVAYGENTTLNELFSLIRFEVSKYSPVVESVLPVHRQMRAGDIAASLADISKARRFLNYVPSHSVKQGMTEAVAWYAKKFGI